MLIIYIFQIIFLLCLINLGNSCMVSSYELCCGSNVKCEQHTETNYFLSVHLTGNFKLRLNKWAHKAALESMALKSVFLLIARLFPYYIRSFGVA